MRLLFLIGLAVVILGALPILKINLLSGDNYQYAIIILGALVALSGLFGSKNGERGKIARVLGFKE